jgi:sugar lactone lactonase YvrE
VNAIALAPDGQRVFVSECFLADGLLEISRDGSGTPRVIARNLGGPNAMSVAADGQLIVPLLTRGEVVRVDPTTGRSTVVVSGLRAPTAVKLAPDGAAVILDGATGEIRLLPAPLDGSSGDRVVARLSAGLDNAVFCGESLLVSSFVTGAVEIFKPWPGNPRTLVKGGLVRPGGIAQSGDQLLISDGISIKRLQGGSAQVLVATVIDALPPPLAIAVGVDGAAYVTVPFRGEVHRVDLTTRQVTKIASGLEWPTSIVALPSGDLLVTETGSGRITQVGRDGVLRVVASGLMSPVVHDTCRS